MGKRKAKGDEEVPACIGPNGEEFFVVESILNKRVKRDRRKETIEYLVKWKDYPDSSNSWEPKSSLTMAKAAIAVYEQGLREEEEKRTKAQKKKKLKIEARKSRPSQVQTNDGSDEPGEDNHLVIEIDGFNGYDNDA